MSEYRDDTYGELIADVYDSWYAAVDSQMLEMLTRLAGGGKALELGIGTGRVAIPLAESGIKMYGIDASPAMVEKLKAKQGSAEINLHLGSFAEIPFTEKFDLVYVVFNTIFALLTRITSYNVCYTKLLRNDSTNKRRKEAAIPGIRSGRVRNNFV